MPDSDLTQTFDYNARAEVFTQRGRMAKRSPVTYKRFATAAEAIRYAIEEMPAEMLAGAVLEVDEDRYGAAEIKNLYAAAGYPLTRAAPSAAAQPK
jgi:Arc/MetJ-type ribon-helix-helix transcriptional regulator